MENLGAVFTDTARLHHSYHHKIFESYNLHRGQTRLFDRLKDSDGISQTELAHKMNITPATLTRMVQTMDRNGFISRKVDEHDQRVTRIYLTEEGKKTSTLIDEELLAVDRKLFVGFSEEEKIILKNMLMRIQDQILKELEH